MKKNQVQQYCKYYAACIRKDIEWIKRAPENGMTEILSSFHETTRSKCCASAKERGADGFVLEQAHQKEKRHWQ